jgi:hypothetical protein
MSLDVQPLITEIMNNAQAKGQAMTRSQAIGHLHRFSEQLIRNGHVPAGTTVAELIAALNAAHA